MPLSSFISDICSSLTISAVWAEAAEVAPVKETVESQPQQKEESEAEQESEKKDEEEKEEEKEVEEEEEEEEEEEPQDPAPAILEECTNAKECKPYKHHFDECVERVNTADDGSKEDCVEEFFHVLHCANACAAPKIWSKLK